MRGKEEIKKTIEEGKAVLGIEFGSTRIKAVLIDEDKSPIASGSYDWENQLVDNVWTYSMEKIQNGLQGCLLYTSPSPRDGLLSRMPSSA